MTSTRLPGKVLLPLAGMTVLEVLIQRLHKYKNNIIIATTDDGTEQPIVEFCNQLNLKFHCGSTENVLQRYYESAKKYNISDEDTIIRITSDCPLIDSNILEKTIDIYLNGDYDYVSNRIDRTIPVGFDVEVFKLKILHEAYFNATTMYEKEHVTPYIYVTKKDTYRLGAYQAAEDNSKYHLALDTKNDYLAIKEVYKKFNNKLDFSYEELIDMLQKNPYIYKINHSGELT